MNPPQRPLRKLCSFDPGTEHPNFTRYDNGLFTDSRRSIHCVGDGRMFEWKEKNCVQLAVQYFWAHKRYWEGTKYIYIEGQFSTKKGKERACLLVRNAAETFFLTLYLIGEGPKPICEIPAWWKEKVGVQLGGGTHDENKERAVEVYKNHPWGGIEEIKLLHQRFGKVIHDPCEGRLMCISLLLVYDELEKLGDKFYSEHKEHNGKTRFPESERFYPLHIEPEKDPMLLVPMYEKFKKGKKDSKSDRKAKQLFKYGTTTSSGGGGGGEKRGRDVDDEEEGGDGGGGVKRTRNN